MTCRFCSDEAVAVFALSAGCLCYPTDRAQALCVQHVDRATPLGTMTLVEVLDPPRWDWYLSTRAAAPEAGTRP